MKKILRSIWYQILIHTLAFTFAWAPLAGGYKAVIVLFLIIGAIFALLMGEKAAVQHYREGKLRETVIYSELKQEERERTLKENQAKEFTVQATQPKPRQRLEDLDEFEKRRISNEGKKIEQANRWAEYELQSSPTLL